VEVCVCVCFCDANKWICFLSVMFGMKCTYSVWSVQLLITTTDQWSHKLSHIHYSFYWINMYHDRGHSTSQQHCLVMWHIPLLNICVWVTFVLTFTQRSEWRSFLISPDLCPHMNREYKSNYTSNWQCKLYICVPQSLHEGSYSII